VIRWTLTGTPQQQAIATEAFNRIKFPFDRLTQLPGSPELGWRDLNNSDDWMYEARGVRLHAGHGGQERADPLEVVVDGRRWTLGVIFTLSGRIFIDISLESDPEAAMAVIGAEIAHAVDFFLPMTDEQRNELLSLWNVPGTTWWEVNDYSTEYFRLGGEAFMHEFVKAYSDLDFGSTGAFVHDAGVEPIDVRRILGIERTDFIVPGPKPHLPEDHFQRYGKSKVYHRFSHYDRLGTPLHDLTGLRPCKVCKPV
jgi:hypothetical protein